MAEIKKVSEEAKEHVMAVSEKLLGMRSPKLADYVIEYVGCSYAATMFIALGMDVDAIEWAERAQIYISEGCNCMPDSIDRSVRRILFVALAAEVPDTLCIR